MNIIFYKKLNIEIFNNKIYPMGTTLLFFLNHLSKLAYNNKFKIESYQNFNLDFLQSYFDIIKELKIEKISSLNELLSHSFEKTDTTNIKNNSFLNIEIEGISISINEFKELTMFILVLDEFLEIYLEDTKLIKIEEFLYYFTYIYDYTIPTHKITYVDDNFLNNLPNINMYENTNRKNTVKKDLKTLKKIFATNQFILKYDCKNFVDVLLASLEYIINYNIQLKNCELCSNFFIANHGNKKFCDNIRPQYNNESSINYNLTKYTCTEYNKKILSYQNLSKEKQAIRTIKANIKKRIKNGTEKTEYLEQWISRVQAKKEEAKKGTGITYNKYIKWITNSSDINSKRKNSNR